MYNDRVDIVSTIYIDYGDGFSETQKQVVPHTVINKRFLIEMKLDNKRMIKAIRFDPVENRICRCCVERCVLDGREVHIAALNADGDNGLFFNVDPQFLVLVDGRLYNNIEIMGRFEYVLDKELSELYNDIRSRVNAYMQENSQLKLEKGQQKIQEYREQIDELKRNEELLNEEINLKSQETKIVAAENEVLRVENNEIIRINKLKEKEKNQLDNVLKMMSEKCEILSERIDKLETEISNIKTSRILFFFRKLKVK